MALRRLLAGAAVVALMTPPALAQDAQQPQAQAEQMVAQEDRDFATEAAQETYHELQQLSGTEFDESLPGRDGRDGQRSRGRHRDLRGLRRERPGSGLAQIRRGDAADPAAAPGPCQADQGAGGGRGRAGAAGPRNGSRWGLERGQPARRGGRHDHVVVKDDAHYAVLSVGGFLGLGEKNVAVPLDELKLSEGEAYLMSAQTEEQLEEMPEYEATQYQPDQR